ncbi:bestrophin family ion channel [Aliiglaciecola sp. 2_MG-2023]|uniref:bestrophin family protein n=1 Tax=unclassified Aliiglaciecola TaxID=2593648 RepID=UPI0026E27D88|nr:MULTISPECIES: bestrophin family ion channel [unclassified Aliiglaciecola]MDO6712825.1 bestrophin family ion channel [Aliiglaciecola sp. 2_MG-2023]MDO6753920.1 bestrophin family ion channel [Aliiglaciecola sp. 1_MG-2023]
MIIRDNPHSLRLFFIIRGSVLPLVYLRIIFITLLGAGVALVQHFYPATFPSFTLAPVALFGVALSLFLGFRNNASYDRWWEGRKQWGKLIVASRSLSRKMVSYVDGTQKQGAEMQRYVINLIIAFSHALRHQLRSTDPWPDITSYIAQNDVQFLRDAQSLTDGILRLIGAKLGECRRQNLISDFLMLKMDEHMTAMADVQASCERIQNTPLPFAYMLLVQRTAYLYCFILPFAIVASQGLVTPLFSAIIAYTFFGLDALSEELEEPFGVSANDLPLHAMSRTIEINLLDILGEKTLPNPIQAHNHRLE